MASSTSCFPLSQPDVEERLAQADEDALKMALGAIIQLYTNKKQFDRTIGLVQQVTSLGGFLMVLRLHSFNNC